MKNLDLKTLTIMLIAFEHNTDDYTKELFNKATYNNPKQFAASLAEMLTDDQTIIFDNLTYLESEDLIHSMNEFYEDWSGNNAEHNMEDIESFLEDKNGCYNRLISDMQALTNVFNKHNYGDVILESDIFELREDHEELKNFILDEMLTSEKDGLTFVPESWSPDRGFYLKDLNFLKESGTCYTPIIVDAINMKVYFSLQGDMSVMFNKDTYAGCRSRHEKMEADNDLSHEEHIKKNPHLQFQHKEVYGRIAKNHGLNDGQTEALINLQMFIEIPDEDDMTEDEICAIHAEQNIQYYKTIADMLSIEGGKPEIIALYESTRDTLVSELNIAQ